MTNRIVGALEHAATRLGKTLGEDAGKAVKDLYHSTGHNLKGIAEDTDAADTHHARVLHGLLRDSEQSPVHAPHEVGTTEHLQNSAGDEWFTGARRRPRDLLDDPAQTRWAEAAYDNFRQDARDIAAISRNTEGVTRAGGTRGFTEEEVSAIKNHLFDTEHPIEDYETGEIITRKFDADPEIADAWIRLRSGRALPEDHVLLEHELTELDYLHNHPGATYQEAHRVANRTYNWQSMVPLDRREDLESEW